MENLWPSADELNAEENTTLQILKEQAKYISQMTNKKIRATFSKISYKSNSFDEQLRKIGQITTSLPSVTYEELVDEELKDKKDINDLYNTETYKFEIYNEKYRFRLFSLYYRELFPIELNVDTGILDEISYKNRGKLYSNSELKSVIREIFSTEKVRIIISKMLNS